MIAELLELAPAGFEQVDGDGWVELALYGAPGELPELPRGRAELAGIPVEVSGEHLPEDWAEKWREFHKPVQIGDIRVRPPWEAPPARTRGDEPHGIDIVIDPGQAFGTGAHPTTRLCLELLQELPARGPLADLGCGSGVLAIAAAKLGFGPIVAVDNEQAAIDATLGNARANGVTLERVERCDLRTTPAPVDRVTVANLVRPLLLEVAELSCASAGRCPARSDAFIEQPEALIVSGLLEGEEDEVAAAFASFDERRRLRLQGWSALLLTRP